MFIDALKVRVTDVGWGRLRDLKSHRYPDETIRVVMNVVYWLIFLQSITCEVCVEEYSILSRGRLCKYLAYVVLFVLSFLTLRVT